MDLEGGYADPARFDLGGPINVAMFVALVKRGELLREVEFDVHLRGGATVKGHATSEDATWECPCGARPDLLSSAAYPVTGGIRIDCTCDRGYWCGPGPWLVAVRGVWEDGSHEITTTTV